MQPNFNTSFHCNTVVGHICQPNRWGEVSIGFQSCCRSVWCHKMRYMLLQKLKYHLLFMNLPGRDLSRMYQSGWSMQKRMRPGRAPCDLDNERVVDYLRARVKYCAVGWHANGCPSSLYIGTSWSSWYSISGGQCEGLWFMYRTCDHINGSRLFYILNHHQLTGLLTLLGLIIKK